MSVFLSTPLHKARFISKSAAPLEFQQGQAKTPYGQGFFIFCGEELAALGFGSQAPASLLAQLRRNFPNAQFAETNMQKAAEKIFSGKAPPLLLGGTKFQHKIWQTLLRLPAGKTCAYQELGQAGGETGKPRAVGGAVGANPVSFLVPCHRILKKSGQDNGYRWGISVKQALLKDEGINL